MDRELVRYLISSGVLTAVLIAIVQFVLRWLENRRDRAAGKPITEAEVRKLEAEHDEMVARTQNTLMERWERELASRDAKVASLTSHIEGLEKRLGTLDATLDDAHEQNTLLHDQLTEEREANKLLRSHLATAIAELDAVKQQLDAVTQQLAVSKQQVAILTVHARKVDEWWQHHFTTNGHTEDTDHPPRLTPFEADDSGSATAS